MGLHGRFGEKERGCDLPVREAAGDENEDVELALGEVRPVREASQCRV
jgi:hypothetical protein